MENNLKNLVIVGGGFAGLHLAKKLSNRKDIHITLIDKNNYHSFQPLMYQVATSGIEVSSIAYPLRKLFHGQKNLSIRMAELKTVDSVLKRIHTDVGYISYDYLVLANGMGNNFFGLENVQKYAKPLKSMEESIQLRNFLLQRFELALITKDLEEVKKLMTIVIAGAGPTGVELAGAITELKNKILPIDYPELDFSMMKIIILDLGSRPLASMSEVSSKNALEALQDFKVDVRFNVGVKDFDGEQVITSTDEIIPTQTLIWAAGVQGNIPLGLEKATLERGKRFIVNSYCQIEGYENIFAAGDIACQKTPEFPNGLPGLAPVAIQQGNYLGNYFKQLLDSKQADPFKYLNKGAMATIGKNKAVVDAPGNIHLKGFIAWIVWAFIHILYLIGFRNKVAVMVDWIWNYISFERRVRLILRPEKRINS